MEDKLNNLKKECLEVLKKADSLNEIQEIDTKYLGRNCAGFWS